MDAQQDIVGSKILEALTQITAKFEIAKLSDAVSKKHRDSVQVLEEWEIGIKPKEPGLGARIRWGPDELEKRRLEEEKFLNKRKLWAHNVHAASLIVSDKLQTTDTRDESVMRTRLLDSIYFQQITERRSRIPQAHAATFEWIYNQESESTSSWNNFVSWLRGGSANQENLYWISGKAGSGKSTLMRYLYEDTRTKEYLRQWSGGQQLLIASCFFWNPGTTIQKSLHGLLRSLLHEILSEEGSLIPELSPWRWRSYLLGATDLENWTDSELLDGLQRIVSQVNGRMKIFIMVDGLDEFEGKEEQRLELVNILKKLATTPDFKLCLSSRPWQVYLDNFEDNPRLRLQDLTVSDIQKYVSDTLTNNKYFLLHEQASGIDNAAITQEIVKKAQGVFLWVKLVVASLLQSLRDGDSVSDLMQKLQALPSDLKEYFGRLLNGLDVQYRTQATKLFQIVLRTTRPISLMTVSFLNEQRPDFGCSPTLPPSGTAALSARLQFAERWLNTRCRGMLEVHNSRIWSAVGYRGVDFLHRTVRDFLGTEDAQRVLRKYSNGEVDASYFLCQSSLIQIRMLQDVKSPGLFDLIDDVMYYARSLDETEPATTQEVLEMIEAAVMHHRPVCSLVRESRQLYDPKTIFEEAIVNWHLWHCSFITLAVQYRWENYVLTKLAAEGRLDNKPGRPLLDFALRRITWVYGQKSPPLSRVVSLCLQRGCSPNTEYIVDTTFVKFVKYMHFNADGGQGRDVVDSRWHSDTEWAKATKLLIENGAKDKAITPEFESAYASSIKAFRHMGKAVKYEDFVPSFSRLFVDGDKMDRDFHRENRATRRALKRLSKLVNMGEA